ncbi:hypothetical protein N7510_002479 [Penicillium lagena]|uniref:uncharacterized protein n=1 Tax=Penicillium lagena TaxID=94218 RepID=UPI00253FC3F2|nr:uncharacterized protein N7510_002479 [Penicillium lagena]KAJ5626170.1 hypothetical protein N7510_002479 [Penicillium lagena]
MTNKAGESQKRTLYSILYVSNDGGVGESLVDDGAFALQPNRRSEQGLFSFSASAGLGCRQRIRWLKRPKTNGAPRLLDPPSAETASLAAVDTSERHVLL